MQPEVSTYLNSLTGHPQGDTASWKARYEPLIDHIDDRFAQQFEDEQFIAPKISVVVVAWRATDGVEKALWHIGQQRGIERHEMEVILVDNSDVPDGLASLQTSIDHYVDVHIKMKGNMGLSPARNTGMAYARGELVCFLDDDGLIEFDYISVGLGYFDDPNVCAIRSRITYVNHPYFTTLAGHYDRGPMPLEDCLVTEGSMMIRRADYMAVGGFADQLYGHEGIELTFQLKQHSPSSKVLYVPDMVMHHDYIHTWQKFIEKNTRYIKLDAATDKRTPELQTFMDEFFARRFPRSPLPPDQYIARHLLRLLKYVLQWSVRDQD